jgi:hypothetical protein
MKRFMFSLAMATVALILGCQNPDAGNPVATGNDALRGGVDKPAPISLPSWLAFDQMITYTNSGWTNEQMRAVGTVIFRITKTPTVPIFADDLYDVEITVNGEISKLSTDTPAPRPAPWAFVGSSKDRVHIPSGKNIILAKKFVVQGASVPTVVNMPFTVSSKNLALRAMSLTRLDVQLSYSVY